MAGTFLVVGLSEDSFTSLTPEQVQKYTEHFKQPEQFISLNGQIIALPAEPENPLRTAEMTLEDDYGMMRSPHSRLASASRSRMEGRFSGAPLCGVRTASPP